jgi:ribulose-phosphate 3-epimerase
MENLVVPSVIAKSQEDLDKIVNGFRESYSVMQIDVMDGEFVDNESFQFPFVLPEGVQYEAHLMIKDPISWIKEYGKFVSWIIFHVEAVELNDVKKVIREIKKIGKKVGIAISPDTPADEIDLFIEEIDMVVVMTVYPGHYGASFLEFTLDKVEDIREANKTIDIEVDGGMNPKNIELAMTKGANRFISGSYLLKSKNIKDAAYRLNRLIKGGKEDEG